MRPGATAVGAPASGESPIANGPESQQASVLAGPGTLLSPRQPPELGSADRADVVPARLGSADASAYVRTRASTFRDPSTERSFQLETWQALFPIALAVCIVFAVLRVCAWVLWYPLPSQVDLPAFPYVVRALALASAFSFACFLAWDRWRNNTGRLLTPIHRHPFALRVALCVTLILQWASPYVSDFYLCTVDQSFEIVNCLTLQSGAFSMPMALTIPLVCLALASILTYAWLAMAAITLSYAALYVYMFVLRNTDGVHSPGPSAERSDALRCAMLVAAQYGLMMVLAVFNISTRREWAPWAQF